MRKKTIAVAIFIAFGAAIIDAAVLNNYIHFQAPLLLISALTTNSEAFFISPSTPFLIAALHALTAKNSTTEAAPLASAGGWDDDDKDDFSINDDNNIVFNYIGQAHPTQGYAYMRTNLDLESFLTPITTMCEQLYSAYVAVDNRAKSEDNYYKDLVELRQTIDHVHTDCNEYRWELITLGAITKREELVKERLAKHLRPHQHNFKRRRRTADESRTEENKTRQKRDFGVTAIITAIVASILGSLSYWAIDKLVTGKGNAIVQPIMEAEEALNHQGAILNRLHEMTEQLSTETQEIRWNNVRSLNQARMQYIMTSTGRVVDKIKGVYDAAIDGRLSTELIRFEGVSSSLERLRKRVEFRGYRLLTTAPMELHQCLTTFNANETFLELITMVPVVTDESLLYIYEFVQWPLRMPDGSWWEINVGSDTLILTNHERSLFRTMSKADLHECRRFRDSYVCEMANVLRKTGTNDHDRTFCLMDLLREDYEGIKLNCRIGEVEETGGMIQIAHNEFLVRNPDPHQGQIHCANSPLRAIPTGFHARFQMSPGCSAETNTHKAAVITESANDDDDDITYTWRAQEDTTAGWNLVSTIDFFKAENLSSPHHWKRTEQLEQIPFAHRVTLTKMDGHLSWWDRFLITLGGGTLVLIVVGAVVAYFKIRRTNQHMTGIQQTISYADLLKREADDARQESRNWQSCALARRPKMLTTTRQDDEISMISTEPPKTFFVHNN
jgi:hypothetical protein